MSKLCPKTTVPTTKMNSDRKTKICWWKWQFIVTPTTSLLCMTGLRPVVCLGCISVVPIYLGPWWKGQFIVTPTTSLLCMTGLRPVVCLGCISVVPNLFWAMPNLGIAKILKPQCDILFLLLKN